ncbi:DNA-directed RNA polymerase subunit beta [Ferviditalea candida]|uniref:DNA-directed RNA polymerase subunit beta n=1 Tax=Ferviditalea candida TaxID=3108399 RepID=A0ABU5ZJ03_9BACL|nr:DNA-directed RNA polymerase subunit beta [Paenibacillaceae bacterium T2]
MGKTNDPNDPKKVNKPSGEKAAPQNRKTLPKWMQIASVGGKYAAVPLLSVAALLVGLIIGYSYLGGQNAGEILRYSTWKHLYDLVFAP